MSSTVSVHRCRFVDYTPTAITAIAFPPLPLPHVKGKGKDTGPNSLGFGTLAVGRTNGNIELHQWTAVDGHSQSLQAWMLQKVLPGPVPSKVDNLVFTLRHQTTDSSEIPQLKDLRLFSTGGGSEVLEWDLEGGGILHSISSQGGSVWSMAANPSSTLLALGCEDGSVRLLSVSSDDLTHYRRFDRVKSRLLSIAWGPPVLQHSSHTVAASGGDDSSSEEDDLSGWVDSWLVTGCSDSSLRKFDVLSGRVLDKMTTDKSRGERTLVWAVGVLHDGTIVSGDSVGTVKFWDSTTCTQLQSFQTHGADVLCLTIGPDGRSVYTSGVDQKVCQFSKVHISSGTGNASSAPSRSKWIHTCSRRLHSHDVRAIAVWPPYSPAASSCRASVLSRNAPILVSGGLDMSLILCPCASPSQNATNSITTNPLASGSSMVFEDAYYRRLPYTTGMTPAVQVARGARLVLCRQNTGLAVWKITKSTSPGELGLADLEVPEKERGDGWQKVLDMELKVRTNLVASAISSNGHWVAASDLHETKLFRLIHGKNDIRPKRVKLFEEGDVTATGATSLLFTSDSSKLLMGTAMGSACVVVVDLASEGGTPHVLRKFEHHRMQNIVVSGNPSRAIKNLPSPVDDSGDTSHHPDDSPNEPQEKARLNTPSIATTVTCMATSIDGQWLASADTRHRIHIFNLDSVQHHCALPSLPQAIVALAFDPGSPSTLVIGLANNTLQAFDVEARQFPEWSHGLSQETATQFSRLHDPLLGITFDPDPASWRNEDSDRRALLWGPSWMCKVKLTQSAGFNGSSKKRRRESRKFSATAAATKGVENDDTTQTLEDGHNFHLVTRYRPLLLVEYVGSGELVVVERPLVDLLGTLPPAYFKPTYGS